MTTKNQSFKVGDFVTIKKIPKGLTNSAGIGTPRVFRQALGKTFRVEGFDDYGHLELVVREQRPAIDRYQSDTIWIEPEFVVRAARRRKSK